MWHPSRLPLPPPLFILLGRPATLSVFHQHWLGEKSQHSDSCSRCRGGRAGGRPSPWGEGVCVENTALHRQGTFSRF